MWRGFYVVIKGYVIPPKDFLVLRLRTCPKIHKISIPNRKAQISRLHKHYLIAHFRVSPPFSKSRRVPHWPKGQLVNKGSLSTYNGWSVSCHQHGTIQERQTKLFKACTLQPEGLSSAFTWPRPGCDLRQITLTLPVWVSLSMNGDTVPVTCAHEN